MAGRDFTYDLIEILEDYNSHVKGVVRTSCEKAAKDTAKRLRSLTSPRRTGDYVKGWAVKKVDIDTFVVHNKTDYQLTHLLENGHVSRNQFGTWGRVSAKPHIAPEAEEGIQEFEDLVRRELE